MRAQQIVIVVALLAACGEGPDDTTETAASEPGTSTPTGTGSTTGEPTGGPTTGTSTGGTDATGTSTGTGTTDASTGSTGSTGGTTDADCIRCGAALMGGDKDELCDDAKVLYDALFTCVCGTCEAECVEACTMGQTPAGACLTCQNDAISGACADDFNACFTD